MNRRCGCEDGGDCTKTSVCAIDTAVEDATDALRDEIEQLTTDRQRYAAALMEIVKLGRYYEPALQPAVAVAKRAIYASSETTKD
jgi:hypothetical protein